MKKLYFILFSFSSFFFTSRVHCGELALQRQQLRNFSAQFNQQPSIHLMKILLQLMEKPELEDAEIIDNLIHTYPAEILNIFTSLNFVTSPSVVSSTSYNSKKFFPKIKSAEGSIVKKKFETKQHKWALSQEILTQIREQIELEKLTIALETSTIGKLENRAILDDIINSLNISSLDKKLSNISNVRDFAIAASNLFNFDQYNLIKQLSDHNINNDKNTLLYLKLKLLTKIGTISERMFGHKYSLIHDHIQYHKKSDVEKILTEILATYSFNRNVLIDTYGKNKDWSSYIRNSLASTTIQVFCSLPAYAFLGVQEYYKGALYNFTSDLFLHKVTQLPLQNELFQSAIGWTEIPLSENERRILKARYDKTRNFIKKNSINFLEE